MKNEIRQLINSIYKNQAAELEKMIEEEESEESLQIIYMMLIMFDDVKAQLNEKAEEIDALKKKIIFLNEKMNFLAGQVDLLSGFSCN